jgi:hypothetical protein
VILHWNSLPSRLQKELFASAGDMDDLMQTKSVRVDIARLLHSQQGWSLFRCHYGNNYVRPPSASGSRGPETTVTPASWLHPRTLNPPYEKPKYGCDNCDTLPIR